MHCGRVFTILSIFAAAIGSAHADSSGDVTAATELGGFDTDIHSGTAVLSTTGFTAPAGQTSMRFRDLVLGVTHNVGGVVDVSIDSFGIAVPGPNAVVGVKVQVYRSARAGVALTADAGAMHWMSTGVGAFGGVAATYCTTPGCESMVSASVSTGAIWEYGRDIDELLIIGALSVVQPVWGRCKVVGELLAESNDVNAGAEFVTATGALRFGWRDYAIDLGLIHKFDQDDGESDPHEARWFPWLAASVRFQ